MSIVTNERNAVPAVGAPDEAAVPEAGRRRSTRRVSFFRRAHPPAPEARIALAGYVPEAVKNRVALRHTVPATLRPYLERHLAEPGGGSGRTGTAGLRDALLEEHRRSRRKAKGGARCVR